MRFALWLALSLNVLMHTGRCGILALLPEDCYFDISGFERSEDGGSLQRMALE